MTNFIKIKTPRIANTAESIFGDSLMFGNKIIFPFFNVHIMPNNDCTLGKEKGKYVKFCYLVFQGVQGITWEYELSRRMDSENRECYGGIYYKDELDYEFWIKYKQGYIYLTEDYQSSHKPWSKINSDETYFFKSIPESLLEVLFLR